MSTTESSNIAQVIEPQRTEDGVSYALPVDEAAVAKMEAVDLDLLITTTDGLRPDEAFAQATGPGNACIVGWPTKLSLAPDLGDRVLALLPPPICTGGESPPAGGAAGLQPVVPRVPRLALPAVTVGTAPWNR